MSYKQGSVRWQRRTKRYSDLGQLNCEVFFDLFGRANTIELGEVDVNFCQVGVELWVGLVAEIISTTRRDAQISGNSHFVMGVRGNRHPEIMYEDLVAKAVNGLNAILRFLSRVFIGCPPSHIALVHTSIAI